ncbi:PWWP domain-containing protein [Phthorimaea operculella]|nr:PWWP domain-containing protein [Phthorimaea operculella]
MSEGYKLGDLVWAKMKGFSPWPGRVAIPTPELKPPKKATNVQCIYFFGTNNYAWIEENNIKPYQEHKETLIKSCKTVAFKEAVAQIEDYILHPENFGDLDEHAVSAEKEFDKLKDAQDAHTRNYKSASGSFFLRLGLQVIQLPDEPWSQSFSTDSFMQEFDKLKDVLDNEDKREEEGEDGKEEAVPRQEERHA